MTTLYLAQEVSDDPAYFDMELLEARDTDQNHSFWRMLILHNNNNNNNNNNKIYKAP